MREKKLQLSKLISKKVKNHIFRHNWIFRHTFCINNPDWQSGGIIIFLCKYFIVISDLLVGTFLNVLFLMLAVILRNQEGKNIQLQKKNCIEEFVWGTSLFSLHALLSMSLFIAFFVYSLPLSKWRTCWIKIHNIAIEGILCDDIMSRLSKIWKSLKYLCNLILTGWHL